MSETLTIIESAIRFGAFSDPVYLATLFIAALLFAAFVWICMPVRWPVVFIFFGATMTAGLMPQLTRCHLANDCMFELPLIAMTAITFAPMVLPIAIIFGVVFVRAARFTNE